MNIFMYAPKDDIKHRQGWREPYTVEEAEQLRVLINSAQANGILFYYALSPGLDMQYSNPKEMIILKRKLDQVKELGCTAFALLFDDIEPELSQADKEAFKTTGNAHVSVTNDAFQHLGQCPFMLCPTEYCSSRANPTVLNSNYLKTIGDKLLDGIDIMWTGTRVIPQTISVAQMEELASVLKRKPVIWDNLHANDYDQKRLFLGPYIGRSTSLIPYIRGVLTNPNCEYELNYIAIHTLAQWSKCKKDAKLVGNIKFDSEDADNKNDEKTFDDIDPLVTYHPRNALRLAILDWMAEFNKARSPSEKTTFAHSTSSAADVEAINASGFAPVVPCPIKEVDLEEEILEDKKDLFKEVTIETMAAEIESEIGKVKEENIDSDTKETNSSLEPMEADPIEPEEMLKVPNSLDVLMVEKDDNTAKSMTSADSSDDMQTEIMSDDSNDVKSNTLTYDDISLLVDLFYLPFSHGPQALNILQEFDYLRANGHLISKHRQIIAEKPEEEENVNAEVNEWYLRASKFNEMAQNIGRILTKLSLCKNRSLYYEIYSYIWDLKGVIGLLNSYVKWVALGKIPMATFFQPLGLITCTCKFVCVCRYSIIILIVSRVFSRLSSSV